MKLNIHHVTGNCWTGFQGHRSKVKVICVQMCECYNGGGHTFRRRSLVVMHSAGYHIESSIYSR